MVQRTAVGKRTHWIVPAPKETILLPAQALYNCILWLVLINCGCKPPTPPSPPPPPPPSHPFTRFLFLNPLKKIVRQCYFMWPIVALNSRSDLQDPHLAFHITKTSVAPFHIISPTSVVDRKVRLCWMNYTRWFEKKTQTTSSRLAKRNLRLGHAYNIHVFIKSLFNICGDIFMNTCIRKVTNFKKNMSHFQSKDHIKPKLVQCKRI